MDWNGAKRIRTADPLHAMQVLYQLSYGPFWVRTRRLERWSFSPGRWPCLAW